MSTGVTNVDRLKIPSGFVFELRTGGKFRARLQYFGCAKSQIPRPQTGSGSRYSGPSGLHAQRTGADGQRLYPSY